MLSEKPWRLDALLWLASGLLLSLCVGSIVKTLLDQWLPKPLAGDAFYAFIVGVVSFQGAGILLIHFVLKMHGFNWRAFLGLDGEWKRAVVWGLAASLAIIPATLALNWLSAVLITRISHEPEQQMVMQMLQNTGSLWERICFGFTAIVLAPIVEESLFRGVLYPVIKNRGFPMLALAGSSLLFAAIHWNLQTFVPLTFLAMMLVLLYEKTDALIAPIVTHSLFNAVNFSLFFIVPQKG